MPLAVSLSGRAIIFSAPASDDLAVLKDEGDPARPPRHRARTFAAAPA
jgi:hypothetical protein